MPELPEVETVRRALARSIPGRPVIGVRGSGKKLRRPLDPDRLATQLVGKHFDAPRREAKFLLLPMREGGRLMVHLGMSGRLELHTPDTALERHTHLQVDLGPPTDSPHAATDTRISSQDRVQLRYVDVRRFGLVVWLPDGASDPSLERLGLDPLADDFVDRVVPKLKRRRAPLKNVLLDQKTIGGLGNIYATEALFRAGIHPRRTGRRTSLERLRDLAAHAQDILREAVEAGGTTLRDFANPDGDPGYFAVDLDVYGREDEPCPRCGTTLRNLVLSNRSTVYCPRCQR